MYTRATKERSSGARILVVRLSSMGDVIHALPAAASLKHSFPGSRLTWVVNPRWAPLLEDNPFIDRVVLFSRHSWTGIRAAWRALRAERFDMAVDFQGLIQSALVASAARPTRIYGFHQSQLREPLAGLVYSDRVVSGAAHVVDRNLDLAARAGAANVLKTFPLPAGIPEGEMPTGRFVLASPLAGWGAKQWPLERYAALARLLGKELGVALVVDGPPHAAAELARITGAIPHFSGLAGLIDATRRAAAVVGVDSGPLHLAAALAKPGVAIFGPTDPARNGPYGGSLEVLRAAGAKTSYKRRGEPDESILAITAEMVFESLRRQLTA